MAWYCYILKCADRTFYTGITNDIKRRIDEHNHDNKLSSKYVRVRRPVKLVYLERIDSKNQALKRENEIKDWNRDKKIQLIHCYGADFTERK